MSQGTAHCSVWLSELLEHNQVFPFWTDKTGRKSHDYTSIILAKAKF